MMLFVTPNAKHVCLRQNCCMSPVHRWHAVVYLLILRANRFIISTSRMSFLVTLFSYVWWISNSGYKCAGRLLRLAGFHSRTEGLFYRFMWLNRPTARETRATKDFSLVPRASQTSHCLAPRLLSRDGNYSWMSYHKPRLSSSSLPPCYDSSRFALVYISKKYEGGSTSHIAS